MKRKPELCVFLDALGEIFQLKLPSMNEIYESKKFKPRAVR